MKKILLSMAVLFLTVFYVNAQSFYLEWNGEVLDSTVTVKPDTSTSTAIVFDAIFHNNTSNGVNIKVIRTEIFMVEGTDSYFCWDSCYLPSVDTSVISVYIPAGSSSVEGVFTGHYEINEVIGVSLIEYKFVNVDNHDEYIAIVVNFDTSPEAINEYILNNMSVTDIYPNPADNFVNIKYDLPGEVQKAGVKIVNMIGSVVKEQQINTRSNMLRMDVSELNGGIYLYSLTINGEIYSTRKLIVH